MFHLVISSTRRCLVVLGITWAVVASMAGCSKDPSGVGKTVPVVGKVTVGGIPVKRGTERTVIFHPDATKGNQSPHQPRGEIDEQGNYKLMTTAKKEGAPLGWYKVAVVVTEPLNPADPYSPVKHLVNEKYADVERSPLRIEVVENPTPGAYDLPLK